MEEVAEGVEEVEEILEEEEEVAQEEVAEDLVVVAVDAVEDQEVEEVVVLLEDGVVMMEDMMMVMGEDTVEEEGVVQGEVHHHELNHGEDMGIVVVEEEVDLDEVVMKGMMMAMVVTMAMTIMEKVVEEGVVMVVHHIVTEKIDIRYGRLSKCTLKPCPFKCYLWNLISVQSPLGMLIVIIGLRQLSSWFRSTIFYWFLQ